MRRKFLSVVLCVCMMLTMAPFAFAEGEGNEVTPTSAPIGADTTTLQSQIDSASSGNTIRLDKNYAESITINNNKAITLDLNGHSLTNTDGQNTITVSLGSTLTVIDRTARGSVNNTSNGKATLYNNGTTAIYAGKWYRSQEAGTKAGGANGNSYYTILNHGDLTINSGSFENKGTFSSMIANGYYSYSVPTNGTADEFSNYIENTGKISPTLTINAGTFTGGVNTIKNDDNGVTTINGGMFTNTAQDCVQNHNIATINGGTFKGMASNGAVYNHGCDATYDKGQLTITGGVFEGNTYALQNVSSANTAKVEITGGRFSHSVSSFLASPYSEANFGEKFAIVTTDTSAAVAEVDGKYFTTFPAAVAAAQTNQTVKLLKSVADSGVQFPGGDAARTLTIDLNSNTYTVMNPSVGSTGTETNAFQLLKGNTITFKNGTVKVGGNALILFQNYCDLTLENVTVDCRDSQLCQYALSNNFGSLTLKGNTNIYAKPGYVAFDLWYGLSSTYYNGVRVTFENDFTGTVSGKVEYGATTAASNQTNWKDKTALAINSPNGHFDITFVDSNANDGLALKDANITISGGYFTTDPTAYLATGYVAGSSDLTGYNYKVTQKTDTGSVEVKPAVAAPEVKVGDKISDTDKADVTAAASSVSAPTLGAAAGDAVQKIDEAKATELIAKANQVTGADKKLYVQSALKVEPTAYNKDTKTLELRITPQYRVVASTATTADAIKLDGTGKNAQVVQDYQELSITQPTEVTMQLPTGFASSGDKLSIKHTKDNGTIEYYTGIVSVDSGKTYVTFTTNGFSPFVISAPVASIGDDVYPSLQAAVDAVQNGQTIKLEKDCAETATVSRAVNFTLNKNSKDFTGAINAGSKYNLTKANGEGTAIIYTVTYVGGGSSSSGTTTSYNVNVNAATNGTVAADKKTASKGTTVTVTASPSKGYVVDAVKVVDKDGKDVAVTEKDGKYVFTMPASAVTVTGSFKAETPAPVALPFTDVKSGNWFYDAVKYAYAQGLMTGTSATTFAPNGTMNRAMIVTVLYRLEKSPAVTGASKFTDVPAGQWYSDAVAWAAANKIVNGYDETTFGPMNAVTREQMAAILFRYEQVKGLENVTLEENLNRFPDQNKISAYAIPALQWAVGQKIINGNADGTLDPTGTATRAQVAQIFTNLLNK